MADLRNSISRRSFTGKIAGVFPAVALAAVIPAAPAPASEVEFPTTGKPPDEVSPPNLLVNYHGWLRNELSMVCYEMAKFDPELAGLYRKAAFHGTSGGEWHFRHEIPEGSVYADWANQPQPSTRAEAVLNMVQVNWRATPPNRDLKI